MCERKVNEDNNSTLLGFKPHRYPLKVQTNFFCISRFIFEIDKTEGYRNYRLNIFRTDLEEDWASIKKDL